MQDTPVYDRTSHDLFHCDVADPGCGFCDESWARQRHPAGDAVAAARERAQHDQAAADAAVQAQNDREWLTRRRNLFTVLATLMLTAAVVLAVTTHPPVNGGELAAVLLTVAGGSFAIAAWALNDRLGSEQ